MITVARSSGSTTDVAVGPVTATRTVEPLVLDAARSGDPGRSGEGSQDDGWTAAWSSALDALELDVEQVERDLVHAHLVDAEALSEPRAWQPPAGLGPLPASLRDRAQAVLERQLDAARRTAEALVASRRHARASQAMRPRQLDVPVYLDTDA